MTDAPAMRDVLGDDPPSNWGRWGADDEVGCLNHLDAGEVLRGVRHVRTGEVFTLQVPMGRTEPPGDPMAPGRRGIRRRNVVDESTWDGGDGPALPGGAHFADDEASLNLQGSTQYDALGHAWYDGRLWNGYDSRSTVGAMEKASVLPIAEKGVVGRGVLPDVARHRGKRWLDPGEAFDHTDLEAIAAAQGTAIEPHDIVLVRTGWLTRWYELGDPEAFAKDFREPGLTHSRELVEWFRDKEIPNLVTDTVGNELTVDPASGVVIALHCALMRNLGVVMTEIARLDELADACAADGRWSFLYAAAPLKVVAGTGAPVNPIAIR